MTDPRRGPSPTSPPAGAAAETGAVPTRDAFAQTLVRSRLLDRPRLDALLAAAPASASARALADHLIEAGELTHYQAEKLLQGRWQGLVLGPYHILAPLGRGGMGTVYLAKNTRGPEEGRGEGLDTGEGAADTSHGDLPLPFSDLIALKVLPPKRAREEEKTLLRFRREMVLGRHLAHPNITRTFDAGEVGGAHYIAMEFVPGQSLRQLVAQGGPLPVADAARLFAEVAAGLAHAHARGLIHRDLKPSNIMVTPDGRAKVLDLGLALLMDEVLPEDPSIVGGEGYILGTMDYIAPEQAANATDVGPWSDIYALGCSVYFAVTGIAPFPGGTAQQKIRWHRTAAPPPVDQINPGVPGGFARVVEQLMAKRPMDRPKSAEVVRWLLLPWAGETVARAPATPAPHTDREAVAEIDRRTLDPSLWDAIPVTELAGPLPPEPAADKPARRQPGPDDGEDLPPANPYQAVMFALVAGGVVIGLAVLTVLFGLIRRL
ncbi:MAG: serine/threonine protein kinase [Gemmataceae bacterium]|nr:serine/threonine protein kinase [Gemmataceae bacterium]